MKENAIRFTDKEGKVLGLLSEHILYKQVRRSKHMLRKPEAWALDQIMIQRLEKDKSCIDIIVYDEENDVRYQVKFDYFIKMSKHFNRGFGDQLMLPLEYWTHTHKEEK